MKKIGIIDLGTNTFNLLLTQIEEQNYTILHKTKIAVKLGEGGITKDLIAPKAYQRGLDALKTHKETLAKYQINEYYAFATSAIRSADNGTHFVNDVSLGSRQFEKPFRAISLCDNQAVITAIANDDGYENIFLQQLQTLAKPGDNIVCISASGNSKNLIKAVEYAKDNGIFVVGLTAFDGGYLKDNCNLNIHVPTKVGEYGPAEDLHMVVCGIVGSYFREKFLDA